MKKLLLFLLSLSLLMATSVCWAFAWEDLWYSKDQQAAKLLRAGKAAQAAAMFNNQDWQAVAHYRAGNYSAAAQQFGSKTTANSWYNKGNALAHLGQYAAAITAYEQALKLNPHDQDAQFNRDLLKKLLQQQDQKKEQQQKQGQQSQRTQPQNQTQQQQQQKPAPPKTQTKAQTKTKSQTQQQEQQQASKQWLNRIPDDPGSLLKQKFLRDYLKRQHATLGES